MSEALAPVVIVGAVAVVALVVALVSRSGFVLVRHARDFHGLEPGLVLFSSRGCQTCDRTRSVVLEVDAAAREIVYEEEPELFHRYTIRRVPTVASVERDGRGWSAEGVMSVARLRRWVGNP